MFGFFKKRQPEPPSYAASRPATGTRRKPAPALWDQPAKLPEVSEGNSEADWAAWEDSVAFQESQMPADWDAPTRPVSLDDRMESERDNIFEREASRKHR